MKFVLNGKKLVINIARCNLSEQIAKFAGLEEHEVSNGIVKYDPDANVVLVDNTIDRNYAIYSAVHECICCGPYRSFAPKTQYSYKRCGLIDRMLLKVMPKSEREDYVKKRIEMYENVLELNLNPALDKQFREAIRVLREI